MKDNESNALYGAMLDRIMLSAMSDAEYREGAPLVKAARRFANARKCDEAGELYDLVDCLRKQGALSADQRARSAALIRLSAVRSQNELHNG